MAPRKKKPVEERQGANFAVVADVHVHNFSRFSGVRGEDGLNARGRLCVKTLWRAVQAAVQDGARVMFVAGDLFHVRRPEPAIIAAVQGVFYQWRDQCRFFVIPGNHDMLDDTASGGNTACQPLNRVAVICNDPTMFDETRTFPGFSERVLCVPFQSRVPMREHLAEILLSKDFSMATKLITHVGVFDDDGHAPPWQKKARDAISVDELFSLMAKHGSIKTAYVGNYHQPGDWWRDGMRIVQVGALCPNGFGEAGLEGAVAVDYGDKPVCHIVDGPRFVMTTDQPAAMTADEVKRSFVRHLGQDALPPDVAGRMGGYEYTPAVAESETTDVAAGVSREPLSGEQAIVDYFSASAAAAFDLGSSRELALRCWREAG